MDPSLNILRNLTGIRLNSARCSKHEIQVQITQPLPKLWRSQHHGTFLHRSSQQAATKTIRRCWRMLGLTLLLLRFNKSKGRRKPGWFSCLRQFKYINFFALSLRPRLLTPSGVLSPVKALGSEINVYLFLFYFFLFHFSPFLFLTFHTSHSGYWAE